MHFVKLKKINKDTVQTQVESLYGVFLYFSAYFPKTNHNF